MNHGLKEEAMSTIQKVLSSFAEVERAVLYGSRAIGNFRPGSDIDLTLIGESLNFRLLAKIANTFDDTLLPQKFDLSIHSKLTHPELLDHIERRGIVVYEREPSGQCNRRPHGGA